MLVMHPRWAVRDALLSCSRLRRSVIYPTIRYCPPLTFFTISKMYQSEEKSSTVGRSEMLSRQSARRDSFLGKCIPQVCPEERENGDKKGWNVRKESAVHTPGTMGHLVIYANGAKVRYAKRFLPFTTSERPNKKWFCESNDCSENHETEYFLRSWRMYLYECSNEKKILLRRELFEELDENTVNVKSFIECSFVLSSCFQNTLFRSNCRVSLRA